MAMRACSGKKITDGHVIRSPHVHEAVVVYDAGSTPNQQMSSLLGVVIMIVPSFRSFKEFGVTPSQRFFFA